MNLVTILKVVTKYVTKKVRFTNILLMVNIGVLILVLLSGSLFNFLMLEFQRQMEIQNYAWKQEIIELKYIIAKTISFVTENDMAQIEIDKLQQKEIEDGEQITKTIGINIDKLLIQQKEIFEKLEKTKKIDIENVKNIKEANFSIYNATVSICGAGSHIKIGENRYVLTCAHLVTNEKDFIWAIDNSGTMRPLKFIKIDRVKDLALFRIYTTENMSYLEISEETPKEGSEVVVIGNPDNLEDVITDGVIMKITEDGYLFTNLIYFGNSGGAILYKEKIIGVASRMEAHCRPDMPIIVLTGFGPKLEVIQEFLKDIK